MAQRFFAEAWPPQSRWDKNNIFWGKATGSEPVLAEKEETKGGTSGPKNKKSAQRFDTLADFQCPGKDSNLHGITATRPLKRARLPISPPGPFIEAFRRKTLVRIIRSEPAVQWCPEQDSNLHAVNRHYPPQSSVSTNFTIWARLCIYAATGKALVLDSKETCRSESGPPLQSPSFY